ncbi:adhesion G protein-coupled receptor E3-like [Heterodontus francisci]|uniref:adhesion G protein-coupled receptor E3-like n=1 Tax=Heterodontus francisci TaxID=7792 RepID=UPI00355B683B
MSLTGELCEECTRAVQGAAVQGTAVCDYRGPFTCLSNLLLFNMKSKQQFPFIECSRFSFLLVLFLCTLVDQCSAVSIPCSSEGKDSFEDSDACLSHTCPSGSTCHINNGSKECHCQTGFELCMEANNCTTGPSYCKDKNECKKKSSQCDTDKICVNTIGSYCCFFKTKSRSAKFGNCSDCEQHCYQSHSNSAASEQLCMTTCQMERLYKTMSMIDRKSDRICQLTRFLDNAENALMSTVKVSSNQREEQKSTEEFEIRIMREINPGERLTLKALGNTMEVDPAVFTDKASGRNRRIPVVAFIVYKNVSNILGNNTEEIEDAAKPNQQRVVLNSAVITAVINSNGSFLTHPINFTFNHRKIYENISKTTCVYWKHSSNGSFWSPEGCELVMHNRTHTVCRVSHLSSFAVLMALKDLPDVFAVEVITYVGLSISLVCLLLAIVTFKTCHPLKDTRLTIHIHLCISLFVADFVFLFGISQTGNRILCGIIAAVLHYSFLSVFVWMLLEGIQLYLMIEIVFVSKLPLERYIYWIGYGLPALIVAVSAAVYHNGYGTPSSCWLTTKKYFVLSFFVPAVIISIINLFSLCKTLLMLKVQLSNIISDRRKLEKHRVFTLTAIGQFVILGCTWIFGVLYIQNATIPMMYLFTILNSFQGMFIFIMHCLFYKKVRDTYCQCLGKCLRKASIWTPVSTSNTRTPSIQGRGSTRETESTTSGAVQ